jgi:hypothetical protein
MSASSGQLVSLKFTCLLPQLLFTYEGNLCTAIRVVQTAISVHGPTILSWMAGVTTKIVGLIRVGPTVEASRTQRLICNKMQHGNTRLYSPFEVMFATEQAMKNQRECRGIALLFL